MKISELEDKISSLVDADEWGELKEVTVEVNGVLYDFTVDTYEPTFDGFDTVYDGGIKLIVKTN